MNYHICDDLLSIIFEFFGLKLRSNAAVCCKKLNNLHQRKKWVICSKIYQKWKNLTLFPKNISLEEISTSEKKSFELKFTKVFSDTVLGT